MSLWGIFILFFFSSQPFGCGEGWGEGKGIRFSFNFSIPVFRVYIHTKNNLVLNKTAGVGSIVKLLDQISDLIPGLSICTFGRIITSAYNPSWKSFCWVSGDTFKILGLLLNKKISCGLAHLSVAKKKEKKKHLVYCCSCPNTVMDYYWPWRKIFNDTSPILCSALELLQQMGSPSFTKLWGKAPWRRSNCVLTHTPWILNFHDFRDAGHRAIFLHFQLPASSSSSFPSHYSTTHLFGKTETHILF